MVFGSSVNPLDINYKYSTNSYEAALAHASAVHARGFECSTPASPSRNSDTHAGVAFLATTTYHGRAASPSPSSDSAAGAAATPPAERLVLGRFSASFPQFASRGMSPLDPVTASTTYSSGIRGPAAGFTTMPPCEQQAPTYSEQLMVTVHPEDLQPPADSAEAAQELAPAPAAGTAPLLPRRVAGFEDIDAAAEGPGGLPASGLSLPPLPPAAAMGAAMGAPQQQYGMVAPVSRPRHGSATTISYGAGGYQPPSPSDAAVSLGMSPCGSLSEHITRTASLPLMMCNAVLPPGASPAIPIAIAGVGASGRSRATTVHSPLPGSGGGGCSIGGGTGSAGGAATTAGAHRGVAQSVDHHYIQRHIAGPTVHQHQQQQQQEFFHQSDGGAAPSSPAHFVGSVSPSGATSFHTAFPGPPSGAATSSGEEVGQQASPDRRPDIILVAVATAASPRRGGVDPSPTVRESGLASSSRQAQGPSLVDTTLVDLTAAARTAAGGAGATSAAGRDTDGDEEFEDAVEVQHDDDDHVSFHDQMMLGGRSPAGPQPPPGDSPRLHRQHQQNQHRLQRCHYATAEPYSPVSAAAAALPPRQLLCGSASGGAAATSDDDGAVPPHPGLEDQPQQHSAPLPIADAGVLAYGRRYEDEGGDQILDDGSYACRRIVVDAEEDEEGDDGGGAAVDLDEEEDVFDGEEDEEVFDGEDEDEDVLDDDEDLAFGGTAGGSSFAAVAVPSPAPPYVTPAAPLEQHICVNCTRLFWGSVCRVCRHPAGAEVVVPELLEGAVQCMLAGQAVAAQQQQHGPAAAAGRGEGVLLAYDDRCRAHLEESSPGVAPDQGRSHPERPERVAAIMTRLQASGLLTMFVRTTGREATLEELVAVHDEELVSELEARTEEVARLAAQRAAARQAGGAADSDMGDDWFMPQRSAHVLDCYFNAATAACARLAAGSAAEVARRVVAGASRHGAAIIRPPGHHAESSVAMGFCYYNNAAVAARAAQAAGARRVLIMDWDVHHGNGTQRIFYDDPSVLYMSTHRYDGGNFYPGTGDATETGSGTGQGFTVNVPWNHPAVSDGDMLAAFRHVILPLASEFRPDLVIVSAGFDAAEGDPLGGCRLSAAAFSHFAAMLSALAPSVLLLEGGYNLTATAAATEACLRVLLGEPPLPLPEPQERVGAGAGVAAPDPRVATILGDASEFALKSVCQALQAQSPFWEAARKHLSLVASALEEKQQQRLQQLQQQEQQLKEQHYARQQLTEQLQQLVREQQQRREQGQGQGQDQVSPSKPAAEEQGPEPQPE